MKILKILTVVFITFFIASFGYFKKDAIACELIEVSHFNEVSPNLYVDQSIDSLKLVELSNAVQAAAKRVSDIYGTPTSNPRIIATAETNYAKFGFNPTGMQNSGLFRECIFLGPKGLNIDVIAHELVHAEVRHRTNLFVELTQLPAWFIEGTGIKADYRKPFLLENIDFPSQAVSDFDDLFSKNNDSGTHRRICRMSRKWCHALRLGPPLPHAPGARMTVVKQTPSNE